MKLNPFKFLKPKNATFCPGCPSKDLNLNKEFTFDIQEPVPDEEPKKVNKVMSLKEINVKASNRNSKIQTLF